MGILWIFVIMLLLFLGLLYLSGIQAAKSFTDRGIHYIGSLSYRLFILRKSQLDNWIYAYKEASSSNQKVAAATEFGQPLLVITDPDLIKRMLIKDFDHFVDKRKFLGAKNDYLINRMLLFLRGDRWKALRSKMSPTFTTGKIRRMFRIFDQISKKLVSYIEQEMAASGQLDLQEGYSKYTMDIIASAAFGIDSQTFNQREASVFEDMGKRLRFSFAGLDFLRGLVIIMFPRLGDFLGYSFFKKEVQDFFANVISSTLSQRKVSGDKRDDFIQILKEAREGKFKVEEDELNDFEKDAIIKTEENSNKLSLDDVNITAQCVLFILGGFDTTQSALIFVAYSLALHQDIQDRLLEEVSKSLEENGGEFTYESVNKMEYLDMVINETMRLYAPIQILDRNCTKEYKVPNTDIIIRKDETVVIPVYGIHLDSKNFPEPEKFDPDRWSPENKHKIHPYSYMPFGIGPRNCIGMRFALTEVKLAVARLVSTFLIEPSSKTLIPMQYDDSFSLKPKGGMWLKLTKR